MTKYTRHLLRFLAALLPLVGVSQFANATASEDVRERFDTILRADVKQFIAAKMPKDGLPPGFTQQQLDQTIDHMFDEAKARYRSILNLPEAEAQALLKIGPNDAQNQAALKRNSDDYKKIRLPLPALMQFLHEKVQAGTINGGWELEFVRRVSDFHLPECKEAQKKWGESQKQPK